MALSTNFVLAQSNPNQGVTTGTTSNEQPIPSEEGQWQRRCTPEIGVDNIGTLIGENMTQFGSPKSRTANSLVRDNSDTGSCPLGSFTAFQRLREDAL